MRHCYHCHGALYDHGPINSPDAWLMVNVAPNAASGGTLVPMHMRCRDIVMPVQYLSAAEQSIMHQALRKSGKIISEPAKK